MNQPNRFQVPGQTKSDANANADNGNTKILIIVLSVVMVFLFLLLMVLATFLYVKLNKSKQSRSQASSATVSSPNSSQNSGTLPESKPVEPEPSKQVEQPKPQQSSSESSNKKTKVPLTEKKWFGVSIGETEENVAKLFAFKVEESSEDQAGENEHVVNIEGKPYKKLVFGFHNGFLYSITAFYPNTRETFTKLRSQFEKSRPDGQDKFYAPLYDSGYKILVTGTFSKDKDGDTDKDSATTIEFFVADTEFQCWPLFLSESFDKFEKVYRYRSKRTIEHKTGTGRVYRLNFGFGRKEGSSDDKAVFVSTEFEDRGDNRAWIFYKSVVLRGDNGAELKCEFDGFEDKRTEHGSGWLKEHAVAAFVGPEIEDFLKLSEAKTIMVKFYGREHYDFELQKDEVIYIKEIAAAIQEIGSEGLKK